VLLQSDQKHVVKRICVFFSSAGIGGGHHARPIRVEVKEPDNRVTKQDRPASKNNQNQSITMSAAINQSGTKI